MTDQATYPRLARRVAAWPGWAHALLVYAVARLVSFVVLERTARFQVANLWTERAPGYLDFATIWDGDWYRAIAEDGYPLPLPRDEVGDPLQSEWAFYPAYPFLVRAVMALTTTSWTVAAPLVSLLVGAAAIVVIHRLFARVTSRRTALVGVTLVAFFPTSPVMQVAYTESLAMLALAGSLHLLIGRRYVAAMPVVLLLGLTRAVALPFALVVAVHLVVRWRNRHADAFPVGERVLVVALGVVSALAGVLWLLVVGLATGDLGAYTDVQGAWRGGETVWLLPWWERAQYYLGDWVGPVVLAVGLAAAAWWTATGGSRSTPVELRAWCLAYVAYLLVVVDPFTSLFRFMLMLFPLALLVAQGVRGRAHLATWAFVMVSLQVVWVVWLWRFSPPSDFPP